MATRHPKYLTAEEKMRLPNPDEAINIAYAIHKADDPDLKNKAGLEVAQAIVSEFARLQGRARTPERPYIDSLKPIVFSYAMAIARRKLEYREELRTAKRIRIEKERQLRGGRFSKQGLAVLGRIIAPLMLLLLGVLVAQLIGIVVPDSLSENTTTGLPSAVLGLVFAFIGRVVGVWVENSTRDKIFHEYDMRRSAALRKYEKGKLLEFELARLRLCEAWRQYTGRSYKASFNYQAVMEGDVELRTKEDEQLRVLNRTLGHRTRDFIIDMKKLSTRLLRRKPPHIEAELPTQQ